MSAQKEFLLTVDNLASDCADSLTHDSLYGARVDGQLAGVAAWLPPEAYPIPYQRQLAQVLHLLPALPWGASAAREALRGQAANRQHHPRDQPHYYLRTLGVVPAHQRSGIGNALLRPVLDEADVRGLGCFLTTATEANVAYYATFGFAVLSSYTPTPAWPQVWAMWREPQTR